MDMGLRPTERYQACVILRARKDLENRCLAKIKLKIWILDLGDSSAAGKKKKRKENRIKAHRNPRNMRGTHGLQREGLHMPTYIRRRAHSCKRFYLNLQSREQGGPLLLPDHTLLGRISFFSFLVR